MDGLCLACLACSLAAIGDILDILDALKTLLKTPEALRLHYVAAFALSSLQNCPAGQVLAPQRTGDDDEEPPPRKCLES